MSAGPLNVFVFPATTGGLRTVILQTGSGLTVRTTSLVVKLFAHEPESVTVRRSVAVAGAPLSVTVVVKEPGSAIEAEPATTVQFVPFNGLVPGWTDPAMVKVVEPPWSHLFVSGPANAAGPITSGGTIC